VAVVTLLNQKGGCGKTSSVFHISAALAQSGRRVLLLDNDPQASLTQGFLGPAATVAIDPSETMAAVYAGEAIAERVVRPTGVPGVALVAGTRPLDDYNLNHPERAPWAVQTALRDFLAEASDAYDIALIDCAPTLLLPSWAALVAADGVVVPLQAEDFGAQGIIDVLRSIHDVQRGPNPGLAVLGLLLTMFNSRLSVHRDFAEGIRAAHGASVFDVMVPLATDYKEAIVARRPVGIYKPRSAAARAMVELAEELIQRLDGASVVAREVA
jgi:chromosome partitioning protein